MTIELSKSQEQKLNALLASGRFSSKEVVLELALEKLAQTLEKNNDAVAEGDDLSNFKAFLQSMPEGLEVIERDKTPTRTVSL